MADNEWDRLIAGLREGNQQACMDFWNQYGMLLEGVAKKQLSDRLQRRLGPDDVVQSACRTFFRRVSDGQFDLPDADALWRLMCAITLTKAKRAARDQQRQKRGIDKEQYLDDTREDGSASAAEPASQSESPLMAVMFTDQLQSLLDSLEPLECEVLDLKLQHFSTEEIAEKLQRSERTIRRVAERIRTRWSSMFDDED